MGNPEPTRRVIRNKAVPRPLTKNEVVRSARMQYHINQLETDYDQIVLRISKNVDGLRNGAAPPTVGY